MPEPSARRGGKPAVGVQAVYDRVARAYYAQLGDDLDGAERTTAFGELARVMRPAATV